MAHWISRIVTVLVVCVPAWTSAHEFWLRAEPFSAPAGATAQLFIYYGEYFEGTQAGFLGSHAASLKHYSASGAEDLTGLIPSKEAIGQVPVQLARAGTHLIAFDSYTAQITLPAEKFEAYLHDEGLDHLIRQRAAAGNSAQPGRERFRRHTKTLLRTGGKSDATYAVSTGQRLQIVPLNEPLSRPAGAVLRFRVLFDGKPLPGALLRAWHHRGEQTISIRATTDDAGELGYTLPYAGVWLISTVQMVAVTDSPDVDWDSFWGSLMFEVPARR